MTKRTLSTLILITAACVIGAIWAALLSLSPQALHAQAGNSATATAAQATLVEMRRLTAEALLGSPAQTPTPPFVRPLPTPAPLWMPDYDPLVVVQGQRLRLDGRGQPGAIVHVLIDDQMVTTTTVGADGAWTARPRLEETGDHTISVLQVYSYGSVDDKEYELGVTVDIPTPTQTSTSTMTPTSTVTDTPTPIPTATMTDTPIPTPTPTPDLLAAIAAYRRLEEDMLRQPQMAAAARLQAVASGEAREELLAAASALGDEDVYQVLENEVLEQQVLDIQAQQATVYELLQRTRTTYMPGGDEALSQEPVLVEMYYRLIPEDGVWKVAIRREQNLRYLNAAPAAP